MRTETLLLGAGATAGLVAAIYYATRPATAAVGAGAVGLFRPVNTGGGGAPGGPITKYLGAAGSLLANASLGAGSSLVSPSGAYHLDMQRDGNLVVYAGAGARSPIWASSTRGSGAVVMRVQTDGNLALYNARGQAVWSTGTVPAFYGQVQAPTVTELSMQDDGNLVLYWTYSARPGARIVLTDPVAVWSSQGGIYAGSLFGAGGGVY